MTTYCELCYSPATRHCRSHDEPLNLCEKHFWKHSEQHRRRLLQWLIDNYDLPTYKETRNDRAA